MADSRPQAARRRRAGRWLLILFCFTAAVVATVYVAGDWMLTKATHAALPKLLGALPAEHGSLRRIEFDHAELIPAATARWSGILIDVVLPSSNSREASRKSARVRISTATATLRGVFPLRCDLTLDGIRVESSLQLDGPKDVPFGGSEFDTPVQRIDAGTLTLPDIRLSGSLRASLRRELPELLAFARSGSTSRPISLSARLHFILEHVPMNVRLETTRLEGRTHLRINRQDLDTLSRRYPRPLTLAERDLLAANPLRAPLLLRIKDYAERTSHRLAGVDTAYNEDSTRHVLWSYWLTRMFDAPFSQQATEAHETGSDNTPQETDRDRHNNRLGREWAEAGKTEAQVLALTRNDPQVRRQ